MNNSDKINLRRENKQHKLLLDNLIISNNVLKQKLSYYENSHYRHPIIPCNEKDKRWKKPKQE